MGFIMKKIADVLFGKADVSPVRMSPKEFEEWKQRQDERLERVKEAAQTWRRV